MRNINDYRQIISEAVVTTIPAMQGSVALNGIDIKDPFDPSLLIKGYASLKISVARKELSRRLMQIAGDIANGKSVDKAHESLVGIGSDATALIFQALAEAEKTLDLPKNKAALTIAKKSKR